MYVIAKCSKLSVIPSCAWGVLGRRSGVSERLCEQLAVPLQHCVKVSHWLTQLRRSGKWEYPVHSSQMTTHQSLCSTEEE